MAILHVFVKLKIKHKVEIWQEGNIGFEYGNKGWQRTVMQFELNRWTWSFWCCKLQKPSFCDDQFPLCRFFLYQQSQLWEVFGHQNARLPPFYDFQNYEQIISVAFQPLKSELSRHLTAQCAWWALQNHLKTNLIQFVAISKSENGLQNCIICWTQALKKTIFM